MVFRWNLFSSVTSFFLIKNYVSDFFLYYMLLDYDLFAVIYLFQCLVLEMESFSEEIIRNLVIFL